MFDTYKVKRLLKKAFTPVTIMLVPHSKTRPLNFKIPFIGILTSIVLCVFGTIYMFSVAVNTFEYYRMKESLNYYSQQFIEVKSTISALKRAEMDFKRLFSVESKEKVFENMDTSDSGSVDIENLKQQIRISMETIGEIKDYLHTQRDIFIATPRGIPVRGEVSSPFGNRTHPKSGLDDYHTGVDISSHPGNSVAATADGIVSYAGWSGGSGNLVVLEHGHGFSTFYAHNRINSVKVGQRVKRGETIAYVGSTGYSTGPHVHYEIWRNGRPVNPMNYIKTKGRPNV